jgi:hypothetical protein
MSVTVENIIPAKDTEAVQTTQYTSANVKTIIDKFTINNTTGAGLTIAVNIVPSAGAASSANLLVTTKTIAANSSYEFPELVGHTMAIGDFISTIASATGLTLRASGRLVT